MKTGSKRPPTVSPVRLTSDAAHLTEGTPTVAELSIPTPPYMSDDARRLRWRSGMVAQLETARLALMDLPDSEGPESLNASLRRADDLLADGVHEHAARARKAIREALEMIHSGSAEAG